MSMGSAHTSVNDGSRDLGIHFDGEGDFAEIDGAAHSSTPTSTGSLARRTPAAGDFAADGTFTVSLWATQPDCNQRGREEWLFTSTKYADRWIDAEAVDGSINTAIAIAYLCTSNGEHSTARPPVGGGELSAIRVFLVDDNNTKATFDVPLNGYSNPWHNGFDLVTHEWVHIAIASNGTSVIPYIDGHRVPEGVLGVPPEGALTGARYIGCRQEFIENDWCAGSLQDNNIPGAPAPPVQYQIGTPDARAACQTLCAAGRFAYFGLRYSRACFCGNSNTAQPADSDFDHDGNDATTPCDPEGTGTPVCGLGGDAYQPGCRSNIAIYNSAGSYVGCFQDVGSGGPGYTLAGNAAWNPSAQVPGRRGRGAVDIHNMVRSPRVPMSDGDSNGSLLTPLGVGCVCRRWRVSRSTRSMTWSPPLTPHSLAPRTRVLATCAMVLAMAPATVTLARPAQPRPCPPNQPAWSMRGACSATVSLRPQIPKMACIRPCRPFVSVIPAVLSPVAVPGYDRGGSAYQDNTHSTSWNMNSPDSRFVMATSRYWGIRGDFPRYMGRARDRKMSPSVCASMCYDDTTDEDCVPADWRNDPGCDQDGEGNRLRPSPDTCPAGCTYVAGGEPQSWQYFALDPDNACHCGSRAPTAMQPVRHPGLKLNIPPQMFRMSWCPDFEFRGTYRRTSRRAARKPAGWTPSWQQHSLRPSPDYYSFRLTDGLLPPSAVATERSAAVERWRESTARATPSRATIARSTSPSTASR